MVSTNDISSDNVDTLAERAVAMAKVAPPDKFAGLADPEQLAKSFPISTCSIRDCRRLRNSRRWRARPKPPGWRSRA